MASYKLLIRKSAAREIAALSGKADRRRIVKRIEALANDPRPPGCQKLSGHNRYRIRQGPYRILYEIRDRELVITVVRVAHRRHAYRIHES